ncbi:Lar family restriction alleviation protein [Enterobacter roggenkampii]
MSELKPCPFCGQKNLLISHQNRNICSVVCFDCGGEGPEELSRKEAITSWNRRAGDEANDFPSK